MSIQTGLTQPRVMVFRGFLYFGISFLPNITSVVTQASVTGVVPTKLMVWAALLSGFGQGLIAIHSFIDSSYARMTANLIPAANQLNPIAPDPIPAPLKTS